MNFDVDPSFDTLKQMVARLAPVWREVLATAATIDKGFDGAVLHEVMDMSAADVDSALEQAAAHSIVRRQGPHWIFAHDGRADTQHEPHDRADSSSATGGERGQRP